MTTPTRPTIKLAGTGANAFALLGAAIRAAKKAGWTAEQIEEVKVKATKGDFENLLRVLSQHFEAE